MKPTRNAEIRDRHNEVVPIEEQIPEEKKQPVRRRPLSVVDSDVPSYMKATKSHEIRGHAIATGALEPDHLEMALQGPLIDQVDDAASTKQSTKKSVGGFLKKKFGLGKGRFTIHMIVNCNDLVWMSYDSVTVAR